MAIKIGRLVIFYVLMLIGLAVGILAFPAIVFFLELVLGVFVPDSLFYLSIIPTPINLITAALGIIAFIELFGWLYPN